MKKITFWLLILFAMQGFMHDAHAQRIGIKTNALLLTTTTLNAGAEIRVGNQWTTELQLMYKPWKLLSDNRKMLGLLVQPEVKYWLCIPFYKHYIGLHALYGRYNGGFGDYRYQGGIAGGGISYGYQWILNRNWNIEVSAALGFAHMNYNKYERPKCGFYLGKESSNYFGPTKIGVSFIYFIK